MLTEKKKRKGKSKNLKVFMKNIYNFKTAIPPSATIFNF